MTLQFGREICGQLTAATRREWLVTNGLGSYACGTVAGVLTRHYHGLLVAALKPPLDRTLLLTKVDETVTYGAQRYALYGDRFATTSTPPTGHWQLERFVLEGTIPTWVYAFEDALLVKRVWMEQGANTTYIRYYLKRAIAPVTLTLNALVNYRNHHHSTRGGDWTMHIEPLPRVTLLPPNYTPNGDGAAAAPPDLAAAAPAGMEPSPCQGIKVTAFAGATPFYVVSDRALCTPRHTWIEGYDLAVERDRGIDPHDDHLHGGTFTITLQPGEFVTLAATTAPPETIQFTGAIKRQRGHEQRLLGHWYSARYLSAHESPLSMEQLVLAADQFIVARPVTGEPEGKTVIAGYPWFGDWGRDTMIALPGLAIATGRPELARPILRTFAKYIDQGMLPNIFPEAGEAPLYNTIDAVLWFFQALHIYHAVSHDCLLIEELFPVLADIIRWHQKGTRYNIHLDADGLIYGGVPGSQLTWMDAKVGDWVVTPRIGKPIEINALWYNALLIIGRFAEMLGVSGADYQAMAEHTRQGFQRFWSGALGHCYDLLDTPTGDDASLRPNQIFAVALPASQSCRPGIGKRANRTQLLGAPLLAPAQQQAIVDTVAQRLLTSHGLRSLAPQHPDYCGHYGGNPVQRDGVYHQGTVWGWLIGPFVEAHLRVYHNPAIARSFLDPLVDQLQDGCIGTLGEIFDGDPPFAPRGAFAQAWTVAEVLRAWCLLDNLTAAAPPDDPAPRAK